MNLRTENKHPTSLGVPGWCSSTYVNNELIMNRSLAVYNKRPVTHFSAITVCHTGVSCEERAFKSASYDGYCQRSVLMFYFAEIVTLLVVETKRQHHGHLDRFDGRCSPFSDVTEGEMLVFLVVTIQLKHCIRDRLIVQWANN